MHSDISTYFGIVNDDNILTNCFIISLESVISVSERTLKINQQSEMHLSCKDSSESSMHSGFRNCWIL